MERPAQSEATLGHLPNLAATAAEPAALGRLQRRALHRFFQLGLPTTRLEEWRFTEVQQLGDIRFEQASPPVNRSARLLLEQLPPPLGHRLLVVNGFPVPDLRGPGRATGASALPFGVVVSSLSRILSYYPTQLLSHLARHARWQDSSFVALNTASFRDGVLLWLPPGMVLPAPIELVHVTHGDTRPVVSYPRTLVLCGAGSRATVVERHRSDGGHLSCPVTEIVLRTGAVLDHYRLQTEPDEGSHIATVQVHQERDTRYSAHTLVIGGGLVRNDIGVVLAGSGGEAVLQGLTVTGGSEHADNHLTVRHASPGSHSSQLFKGVLGGTSRTVFNGRIVVEDGAQKTDARQSNRSLLLSRQARVHSNPQLEILADDVRCTHGSTVGQLDQEAIFYLRSRGIPGQEAELLLTRAFAAEVVASIGLEPLRREADGLVNQRLFARTRVSGEVA